MNQPAKRKIAIIGGGIAGLTAAYLLQQNYDITLFERSDRLGGNAFTLNTPDGQEVDVAAAVFGRNSYRNVFRLFKKLNIGTQSAFRLNCLGPAGLGASFRDLDTGKGIFLTPNIRGLLSQQFEILRPDRLKALAQLAAGVRRAGNLLRRGELNGLTVGQALESIPELTGDAKLIFVSCLCLISSMHCDAVLDAPAVFFAGKLSVHDDLLPPKAFFSVALTSNRTRSYVDALSAGYRHNIVFNANIRTVARHRDHVVVIMDDGAEKAFEKVVFGCNADQALGLLAEPTADEKRLLGAWKYTEGRVVVHADHTCFPRRELMEGYTFLYRRQGRYIETSVSGSLWSLPGVSKKSMLISTQHPNFPIGKDSIVFEKIFRTPVFDFDSCSTIPELPSLNGVRNTYYCGSHFGFGLHEDAVTSAIDAARELGASF